MPWAVAADVARHSLAGRYCVCFTLGTQARDAQPKASCTV